MARVSIIMPCYNDGRYLRETFDSIAAQTWPDIEVIEVDDGSDDAQTLDILHQLEAEGRLTLLQQDHQGPSAARNLAFRHATGSMILPLDADDGIDPAYIEKAAQVLAQQPEVGVCYGHADLFDGRTGPWELPDYSLQQMLTDNVVFVTSLCRREVFEQAGGFDESFRTGMEDYDFFLTALENGWKIHQLPETLFHYRIKNASRSQKLLRDNSDYLAVYDRLYHKHRALYAQHMDLVVPHLRRTFLQNRQEIADLRYDIVLLNRELEKLSTIAKVLKNFLRRVMRQFKR